MAYPADRLVTGFQLGTIIGTVLYTPVNFSAEIYRFEYILPDGTGTVAAEMLASTFGTITGTIDAVILTPAIPSQRDSTSERPIARVEGGQYLVGVVVLPTGAAGSIEGVVEYRYVPGRVVGA